VLVARIALDGVTALGDVIEHRVALRADAPVRYRDPALRAPAAGAAELQAAAALVDTGKPVRPDEFAARFAEAAAELTSGGANPNPIFTGMMGVNKLGELGLQPDGKHEDAAWSRPALVDPQPVSGMPHGLAVPPAAVLRWKLHGNGC